jgi:NitT/TauT family transport system substrate-binding protein
MPVYLTGQPVLAKMQGYAVNTIDPTDYGVRLYGNVYFTSEMMIRTKPETVRRFVLGLLQGWRDAVANPDEAVKMMVKIEPKLDANQEREFFAATQKYLRFGGDSLGTMSRSRWQETADIMVKYGGLNSDIAIDSVFTNVFVDAAYKEIERNH